jgi:hypothetical protein
MGKEKGGGSPDLSGLRWNGKAGDVVDMGALDHLTAGPGRGSLHPRPCLYHPA